MRVSTALLAVIAATQVARAQPADPYGPPPAPVPVMPGPAAPASPAVPPGPATTASSAAVDDPALAEQVARALVHRAQALYDARAFADAKQLATEALARRSTGATADHARYLIQQANKQLGITGPAAPAERLDDQVDLTPFSDRTAPPPAAVPPQADRPGASDSRLLATRVHGALYLGTLGATVGALVAADRPAAAGVPLGIAGGLAGGLLLPRLIEKRGWTEAQIRTTGMGSTWGGVIGGLFADAVNVEGTTAQHVLIGASVGSTLGLLGGASLARRDRLTRGDVALIDTLAGIGAVGGLTMGMLMQPAEGEAYAVNSIVGTAGGLLIGYVAAPQTSTTPRRMLRVAAAAAIGGALPFLLYAGIHDRSTQADERVVGLLSSAGLVGGLLIGFRLTRGLDVDRDVRDGATVDDAPAAVVRRSSDGRWALGGLALQPLASSLSPTPGLTVSVIGARF